MPPYPHPYGFGRGVREDTVEQMKRMVRNLFGCAGPLRRVVEVRFAGVRVEEREGGGIGPKIVVQAELRRDERRPG